MAAMGLIIGFLLGCIFMWRVVLPDVIKSETDNIRGGLEAKYNVKKRSK